MIDRPSGIVYPCFLLRSTRRSPQERFRMAASDPLDVSRNVSHSEMTRDNAMLFWGCFIALVTTAFSFIARMFLIGTWQAEFNLDSAQAGRLAGMGIWPFAVSIIGFSLFIDKIGYKTAMVM